MPSTDYNGLPEAAAGFANPMTQAADMIVGGAGGTPTRLAKGTALQTLRMNAGATAEEWATAAALPTAAGADETPMSTGAGTTYTARTAAQVNTSLGAPPQIIGLGGYRAGNATIAQWFQGGVGCTLDPTALAKTGLTQTWTFHANASVTAGRTGTIILYDVTAAAIASTITVTATTPTAHTGTAITLPGTPRLYIVYFGVDGTTDAHIIEVNATDLKVSYAP